MPMTFDLLLPNCTETLESRGVQPLLASLESIIGGWPLLRKSNISVHSAKGWRQMAVDLISKAGLNPGFGVTAKLVNDTKYLTVSILSLFT